MSLFDSDDYHGWIVIPNWDRFQHYKDRRPVWIKLYPELLDDPAYLALPPATRCLLVELWMLYATSRGQVAHLTATLQRRLGHRVFTEQIEALRDAGFIATVASKPLAQRRERERDRRTVDNGSVDNPAGLLRRMQ